MFVAPMVISSPEYIIGQYHDWYVSIVEKNADNMGRSQAVPPIPTCV